MMSNRKKRSLSDEGGIEGNKLVNGIISLQRKCATPYKMNKGIKFKANPFPTLFHECMDSSIESNSF
jgi:hypothetical protein